MPADWNTTDNSIETIGAGGGGGTSSGGNDAGGGGGGGYSKIYNLALTPGATIAIQVGAGGSANIAGGDTWFNGAGLAVSSVGAKGGRGASGPSGGAGGDQASGIGTVKYSGGNGGNSTNSQSGGAGGGGAGGPNGTGKAGALSGANVGSGGGGGGGGSSTAGSDGSGDMGGGGGDGPEGHTAGSRGVPAQSPAHRMPWPECEGQGAAAAPEAHPGRQPVLPEATVSSSMESAARAAAAEVADTTMRATRMAGPGAIMAAAVAAPHMLRAPGWGEAELKGLSSSIMLQRPPRS